ncbi:MAG: family 16 glycosylhydrolase [Chitinophagaceae bacterium]|jgi:beta-glucanase (GH16 family)|nr:family 16 glycosylhydrolase [Chitinophagaceae bacterium]
MKNTLKAGFSFMAILAVALQWQCSKSSNDPAPPVPAITVSPVTANEGTGANLLFSFEFKLSAASTQSVSVSVATEEATAKAGLDFIAFSSRTVSFQPGETQKTLQVEIVADEWKENTEEFRLLISNPVNGTLPNNTVRGYITNDDTQIFFDDAGYNTPNTYPGYTLVWADEFDGNALNLSDWNFETGDGCPNVCGWGNNELEWYTNGENLYLQRGKLIIEARNENVGGKNYTSSRITTQRKKSFQYGRIDIRAKMPYGQGIWPALWMLGNNISTVGWPACGEMDMMELLGHEPNKVHATAHYATGAGARNISKSITKTESFSDAFHVFSLVWVQDKIQFLVDDQLINEVTKNDIAPNNYPFNEPFFFIFNIAVGGNWPGSPNSTTTFPQWMFVDYVRVFQ